MIVKYTEPPEFVRSSEQAVKFGTHCVSITLDRPLKDLPDSDPVEVRLPLIEPSASYCGYWDEAQDSWSDAGCWTHEVTAETLVCRCTHLTLFAGFLEALIQTLDCSNRPDEVFAMLVELPAEAWAPVNL